jgi:hypothetical protein
MAFYDMCAGIADLAERKETLDKAYRSLIVDLRLEYERWLDEESRPMDKLLALRKKRLNMKAELAAITKTSEFIGSNIAILSECCVCHRHAMPRRYMGVWYCVCEACEEKDQRLDDLSIHYVEGGPFDQQKNEQHYALWQSRDQQYWKDSVPILTKLDERFHLASPSKRWIRQRIWRR